MIQIRSNVFETNSSSTHSITFCSEDEYQKWVDGEVLLLDDYRSDSHFITIDEAKDIVRERELESDCYRWGNPLDEYYGDNAIENGIPYTHIDDVPDNLLIPYLAYHEIYTCDSYFDKYERWFETYEEHYTTEHGDEIVAFGFYGID